MQMLLKKLAKEQNDIFSYVFYYEELGFEYIVLNKNENNDYNIKRLDNLEEEEWTLAKYIHGIGIYWYNNQTGTIMNPDKVVKLRVWKDND